MEFVAWPKTPRLFRDIVITEKIDGTNAAISISGTQHPNQSGDELYVEVDGGQFLIGAQSRKRIITPSNDNAGFASWVGKNADNLVRDLGVGRHYGEWWGTGIQRRYGLDRKLFSLFNVSRYEEGSERFATPELRVVPTLYRGEFSTNIVLRVLQELADTGSVAAKREGISFNNPEGVITFHTASNSVFKTTYDDSPKGE